MLIGEKLNAFPEDWEQRKEVYTHHFCSTLYQRSSALRQRKKKTRKQKYNSLFSDDMIVYMKVLKNVGKTKTYKE